jgi:hypothetical protein
MMSEVMVMEAMNVEVLRVGGIVPVPINQDVIEARPLELLDCPDALCLMLRVNARHVK